MNQNKVTSGLIWSFAERIAAQLVSTVVTIILARILDPEHYGVISIVTVFTTICNVFVTSGFGSAIVQKKEIDDLDLDTAFVASFVLAVAIYFFVYFMAPILGQFYEMPELVPVTRVMAFRIVLASMNTVQQANVRRQMAFKRFFVATLSGTAISAVVGIAMALNGFGVWALVGQYMTSTTIETIVMLFVGGWKPKFQFSLQRAKEIMSFGWKVLATDLVSTLGNDFRSLVVGKVFGATDLAFHDQGKRYPSLLVNNVNTAINKVMLPAYSQKQDDLAELKKMLRSSIQTGAFVLVPIMIGFAVVADTFVSLVLTDKWLACVPYIQIFCLSYLTRPMETSCHQAILAIGKGEVALKIIVMINIASLLSVIVAVFVFESVMLVAVGSLLTTMVSFISFMYYANKTIGYRTKEQLLDLVPTLIVAVVMGVVVRLTSVLPLGSFAMLVLQIGLGVAVYLLLGLSFKIPGSQVVVNILKHALKKKRIG